MPHYLVQVRYTAEACAALIRSPQERREAVSAVVARFGGRVESFWYLFGDDHVIVVLTLPDNAAAAAFSLAVMAGAAVEYCRVRPLFSEAEAVEIMRRAGTANYRPPRA